MKIVNGLIFTEKGCFEKGSLILYEDRISDIQIGLHNADACGDMYDAAYTDNANGIDNAKDMDIIDATDMYVIPGLTDIHFHGNLGNDFCDGSEQAIKEMAHYELMNGVTQICPASMTYDEDRLTEIFKLARIYYENQDRYVGASLVGINMEGPFIAAKKAGAQNLDYITAPDVEMFNRLQAVSGDLIKLCDIAPESDGAIDFIKALATKVHISIAHTEADYDTAMLAFENGADHVTHLFNAMNPFSHRNPGVIGAAFDSDCVYTELITDGVHVAPSAVRMAYRLMGDEKIVLISDSTRATGLGDGEYELGGQKITSKGNLCVLDNGTIAGSNTNLMDCLRCAVKEMGIPLESAIKSATENSAKSIGIFSRYGSLSKGKMANIVILDKELNIRYIIKDGQLIQPKSFDTK